LVLLKFLVRRWGGDSFSFFLGFILSVFCALAAPEAAFDALQALAAVQRKPQPEGSGGADLNELTAGNLSFYFFIPDEFDCLSVFVCL
jgi:hypothetical protein